MAGQRSFNLLKDYVRLCDSDSLIPPFNNEELKGLLEEINVAFNENHVAALKFQETRDKNLFPAIGFRHALLQRNKRCVLAYVYNRLLRLKEIRWNLGPELADDIQKSLIEPEIQWYQNYNKLLSNYMSSVGREYGLIFKIDAKPPKSLYIEVRCLADYGRFELGNDEVIILKKNSQHYLPKAECEHLIRQGILEHIVN